MTDQWDQKHDSSCLLCALPTQQPLYYIGCMDREEDITTMTLAEYADIIRCNIIITRYHNQNDRYTVKFEGSKIKEGAFLSVMYGNADTIVGALEDYVDKIKGKLLVIDAYTEHRREYGVPNTLTV